MAVKARFLCWTVDISRIYLLNWGGGLLLCVYWWIQMGPGRGQVSGPASPVNLLRNEQRNPSKHSHTSDATQASNQIKAEKNTKRCWEVQSLLQSLCSIHVLLFCSHSLISAVCNILCAMIEPFMPAILSFAPMKRTLCPWIPCNGRHHPIQIIKLWAFVAAHVRTYEIMESNVRGIRQGAFSFAPNRKQ